MMDADMRMIERAMKRSSTMSGHRDFVGHAVGRRGIRSLGVIIMGGVLSLALVISAGMSLCIQQKSLFHLGYVANWDLWNAGWASRLLPKFTISV